MCFLIALLQQSTEFDMLFLFYKTRKAAVLRPVNGKSRFETRSDLTPMLFLQYLHLALGRASAHVSHGARKRLLWVLGILKNDGGGNGKGKLAKIAMGKWREVESLICYKAGKLPVISSPQPLFS